MPRPTDAIEQGLGGAAGVTAVVLAGGASRRMGRDKIAIPLRGRPLLAHALGACAEVASERIVVGREQPPPGVPAAAASLWIADDAPPPRVAGGGTARTAERASTQPRGPLAGLATGLAHARGEIALLVGGDMPHLRPDLLALIAGRAAAEFRAVLPLYEGRPQPLCSAWPVALAPTIAQLLAEGERSPLAAARVLDALLLQPEDYAAADPRGESFHDVDTPEALAVARWTPVAADGRRAVSGDGG